MGKQYLFSELKNLRLLDIKVLSFAYINNKHIYQYEHSWNGPLIQILNIVMQTKSKFQWLEAHSLIGRPY
jgi:hypothetical protein